MATQLDRIESMLRALCTHLGVQMGEQSGNGGPESFDVDAGPRYTGVVSRFEHGWGFIECEAMNRNFFVHYSDIEGSGMRLLEPGEMVSFELASGKDGRPKAVRVRRQAPNRSAPRPARLPGLPRLPRGAAGNGAGGEIPEIDAVPERSDLPEAEGSPEQ